VYRGRGAEGCVGKGPGGGSGARGTRRGRGACCMGLHGSGDGGGGKRWCGVLLVCGGTRVSGWMGWVWQPVS